MAALAADGLAAWAQVIERGYEGYVAKNEASGYEGGQTRRWLKVKVPGWTVEEDRWQRRIFEGIGDDAACSKRFAGHRATARWMYNSRPHGRSSGVFEKPPNPFFTTE